MTLRVKWIPFGYPSLAASDPKLPEGYHLDVSYGLPVRCTIDLTPYPAGVPGYYLVECDECGQHRVIPSEGLPDGPRIFSTFCLKEQTPPNIWIIKPSDSDKTNNSE